MEKHAVEYVDDMLEVAKKHDLIAEVVISFGHARNSGFSTLEAINIALTSWDI